MLSSTGRVPPTSVQAVHTSAGGVPSTLANLPADTLMTGTVTGRDATGRTLLRTDAGTLALAARLDRGSVVILRIRGGPTFSATIVSVDGRPLLNLPFGTVRIETPASVPTGTTPALTVLGVEPEAPPPMPDGARREIGAIFDDGLAVGGLAGTLSIQVAGSFPVAPLEEIVAGERSGVLA